MKTISYKLMKKRKIIISYLLMFQNQMYIQIKQQMIKIQLLVNKLLKQ